MMVRYRVVIVTRMVTDREVERIDMLPEDTEPRWTITKADASLAIFVRRPEDFGKYKVGDIVPIDIGFPLS